MNSFRHRRGAAPDPLRRFKRLSHSAASAHSRSARHKPQSQLSLAVAGGSPLRTPWRDVSYKLQIYHFLRTSQPHRRQTANPSFSTSIRFVGGSASILQYEVAGSWGRCSFLRVDSTLRREGEFNETTCFTVDPPFDLQTCPELQECQSCPHNKSREELSQRADQCSD